MIEHKGICFVIPSTNEPEVVNDFRKNILQWRNFIISCCENISMLYNDFFETKKKNLSSEYSKLKKELSSITEDPLGIHEEETTKLEKKLDRLSSKSFLNSKNLPLYFPLFCIIDYFGCTCLAFASINEIENQKKPNPLQNKFFQHLLHNDLIINNKHHQSIYTNNNNNNSIEKDEEENEFLIDETKTKKSYISIFSSSKYIKLKEDIKYINKKELHSSFNFDKKNFFLRNELCKKYKKFLENSNNSSFFGSEDKKITNLTEFLHFFVIPNFCSTLLRIPLTGSSICMKVHQNGINLRHLGIIYSKIDSFHKPAILLEMISRIIAKTFREEQIQIYNHKIDDLVHDNKQLWRKYEKIILHNENWWEILSIKEKLLKKYYPVDDIEKISFHQVVCVSIVIRVQELLKIEGRIESEFHFLPNLHQLPLFSLSQVILSEKYYSATRDLPVHIIIQLFHQCIEYEHHYSTSIASYTQKSLSLWDIVQELRNQRFPSVSTIYEVLLRCKDSLKILLSIHSESLIGHLLLGSVYSEIAFLIQKHSILLQEKHNDRDFDENFLNPSLLITEACNSFQRVLLLTNDNQLSSSSCISNDFCLFSQFISKNDAKALAFDYWNCFLSKFLDKQLNFIRNNDWVLCFSLVCEQLLNICDLKGYEDSGEISLQENLFLDSLCSILLNTHCSNNFYINLERHSVLFCFVCILNAPDSGPFIILKDSLNKLLYDDTSEHSLLILLRGLTHNHSADIVIKFLNEKIQF